MKLTTLAHLRYSTFYWLPLNGIVWGIILMSGIEFNDLLFVLLMFSILPFYCIEYFVNKKLKKLSGQELLDAFRYTPEETASFGKSLDQLPNELLFFRIYSNTIKKIRQFPSEINIFNLIELIFFPIAIFYILGTKEFQDKMKVYQGVLACLFLVLSCWTIFDQIRNRGKIEKFVFLEYMLPILIGSNNEDEVENA